MTWHLAWYAAGVFATGFAAGCAVSRRMWTRHFERERDLWNAQAEAARLLADRRIQAALQRQAELLDAQDAVHEALGKAGR